MKLHDLIKQKVKLEKEIDGLELRLNNLYNSLAEIEMKIDREENEQFLKSEM